MCDCFNLLMLMCTFLLALLRLEKHHVRKAGLETTTGNQTAVTLQRDGVTSLSPMRGRWALLAS